MGALTPDQPTGSSVQQRRRRVQFIAAAVALIVTLAVATTLVVLHRSETVRTGTADDRSAQAAARAFLTQYVDPDGRVVRRDQGSDTVSEGQAYGLLAAVVSDDHARFTKIWTWTKANLSRPDGLLSWTWKDGKVADPNSAADADLDTAWALTLGGTTFSDAAATTAGSRMATAILDHETVSTSVGPVLVAGNWATSAPYSVDPSYFAPAAFAALGKASGDATWARLATTSRLLVTSLVKDGHLPPDWARVSADGTITPASSPGGQSPRFADDAQRLPVWYASSCSAADRRVAAAMQPLLSGRPVDQQRAVYDLSGSPQVGYDVPLGQVAASASASAAGKSTLAADGLADAERLADQQHTYYGAAWLALGRTLLTTDLLGSCPSMS